MEKYSQFNDAFTGINPFVNPRYRKLTFTDIITAVAKLPLLVLLYFRINTVSLLITIKGSTRRPRGITACNCASIFDKHVIRAMWGNVPLFYLTKDGFVDEKGRASTQLPPTAVVFVEGCASNNRSIMQFVRSIHVDNVLGLRYNSECIYMYGSLWKFLIRFLGSRNRVDVAKKVTRNVGELMGVSGLKQVSLGLAEKQAFMGLVHR